MELSESSERSLPQNFGLRDLIVSSVATFVGGLAALYTTSHHLSIKRGDLGGFACNINDYFSCDKVALSPYSELFNIPLGIWGMGYFAAILSLSWMALKGPLKKEVLHGLFLTTILGALGALTLLGVSVFVIKAVCLACSVFHLCAITLAAYFFFRRRAFSLPLEMKTTANGAWVSVFVVAIFVLGYQFFQPPPQPVSEEELSKVIKSDGQFVLSKPSDFLVDKTQYSGYGMDFQLGPVEAKVEIVEFADLQCPACKHIGEILKKVQESAGEKVALVFKNYPLDKTCNSAVQGSIHQYACQAAVLARCGDTHQYFWSFLALVYKDQSNLSDPMLDSLALQLGMSQSRIKECRESKSIMDKIKDDVRVGNELQINSTPTIFINKQKYVGPVNFVALSAEVNRFLGE